MDENTIRLFGSRNSDHWETPKELYDKLNLEFKFDYDPCPLYATFDGLECDWVGNVFVNPPYSNITKFLIKAHEELDKGNAHTIVFLTFSNTDTRWFHDYVYGKSELRFIKGRLKFKGKNKDGELVNGSAMRPSMLAIFTRNVVIEDGM